MESHSNTINKAKPQMKTFSVTVSTLEFHYFKVKIFELKRGFFKENVNTVNITLFSALDIKEIYDSPGDHEGLDVLLFRNSISKALQAVNGHVGTGIQLDILKYSKPEATAILRVQHTDKKILWHSLMLHTFSVAGKKAKFDVLANSASCLGLCVSSRDFKI